MRNSIHNNRNSNVNSSENAIIQAIDFIDCLWDNRHGESNEYFFRYFQSQRKYEKISDVSDCDGCGVKGIDQIFT